MYYHSITYKCDKLHGWTGTCSAILYKLCKGYVLITVEKVLIWNETSCHNWVLFNHIVWLYLQTHYTYNCVNSINYSLGHGSLRQCILAITQPILDLYLWKFICMSIFIYKKYVPKKSQKIPNLAKFWNWHKTLKEQEKSIFWP